MTTTADLREFNRAIANVVRNSKKPEAEIVNRAARDIAFRSAQATPKTTAAKIGAELKRDDLAIRIAVVALNRDKGKGRWTTADLKAKAKAVTKRRRSGAGALRAGWIPAIVALGGTYRGAKITAGSASKGGAKVATANRLTAIIRNAVKTVNSKGQQTSAENIAVLQMALKRGVQFVTNDRNEYAMRKMNQLLKKHSDK